MQFKKSHPTLILTQLYHGTLKKYLKYVLGYFRSNVKQKRGYFNPIDNDLKLTIEV
ncbi:hypothetical protein OENI_130001 [Oenococcus oeni]|nr:hypothetical protein OENI_130001 [Oenococcus oeni]